MDFGGSVRGLRWFALVGLLMMAGCGSAATAARHPALNETDGDARNVVKAAFTSTIRAGTAKVVQQEFETSSTVSSASHMTVNADVRGAVDFRARSLELVHSWPRMSSGTTYVVVAGHTYINIQAPNSVTVRPGTKPWIRTTEDRPGLNWLILGLPADPTTTINALSDSLVAAQRVGVDVVRGARAAHYRIKINLVPTSSALQGLDCAHPTPTPAVQAADVWLDSAGRMVRLRLPYEAGLAVQMVGQPPATPATSKGFTTTELYQFGDPVSIHVPPAAETFIDPSESSGPPTAEQGPCQDTAADSGSPR